MAMPILILAEPAAVELQVAGLALLDRLVVSAHRATGGAVTLVGPYHLAFTLPKQKDANLLMIGLGTGIAPFRAFVKHIYSELGGWKGKVRLFHGAMSGGLVIALAAMIETRRYAWAIVPVAVATSLYPTCLGLPAAFNASLIGVGC